VSAISALTASFLAMESSRALRWSAVSLRMRSESSSRRCETVVSIISTSWLIFPSPVASFLTLNGIGSTRASGDKPRGCPSFHPSLASNAKPTLELLILVSTVMTSCSGLRMYSSYLVMSPSPGRGGDDDRETRDILSSSSSSPPSSIASSGRGR